jgi:hypothetical protein
MATLRRRPVVAVTAIGPGVLVRALLVSELTLWVSQRSQQKCRGSRGSPL